MPFLNTVIIGKLSRNDEPHTGSTSNIKNRIFAFPAKVQRVSFLSILRINNKIIEIKNNWKRNHNGPMFMEYTKYLTSPGTACPPNISTYCAVTHPLSQPSINAPPKNGTISFCTRSLANCLTLRVCSECLALIPAIKNIRHINHG